MSTKRKAPDVLDDMIEHVRYEMEQVAGLLTIGNGWCELLRPDLAQFARQGILEAGLIHIRCLIEFLGNDSKSDRVAACDYLEGWQWKISDHIGRIGELHGRLAHLGTTRAPVRRQGAFRWDTWLVEAAPVVLAGLRQFLSRLRTESDHRYRLFVQPDPSLPAIEPLELLDRLLGTGK